MRRAALCLLLAGCSSGTITATQTQTSTVTVTASPSPDTACQHAAVVLGRAVITYERAGKAYADAVNAFKLLGLFSHARTQGDQALRDAKDCFG